MTSPSDQLLAEQVRQGNEQAFVHLIRRYERTLVGLIRHRVGSGDQVQDVLQETLVHIWSGLCRDTPRDVRAWLLQVARNRCRDYFRSTQRRELFVETKVLTPMVNRFGVAQARQREAAAAIVEAMEEVPDRERTALKAFYLDGLSIAEIAARHRCPDGTVKRRLSHGRDRIRTALGVPPKKRSKTMSASQQRPFPQYRPEIRIEASQEEPFRVDFKEMAWWFIVPEVGDRVRWASYDPPKEDDAPWRLSETVSLTAQRPAIIHGRSCVEIEVENQHLTAMIGDNVPNKKKGCPRQSLGLSGRERGGVGRGRIAAPRRHARIDDFPRRRILRRLGPFAAPNRGLWLPAPPSRRLARKTGRRIRSNGRRGVRRADRSAAFYLHARL